MQLNLWSGGPTLTLADYWQRGNTLQDDPPDTRAFGYRFDSGATGSVMTHAYPTEYAMPLDETTDDPTGGWARDPYTGSSTGFVMNISELPDFDGQCPAHPLSMAREVVAAARAS